MKYRVYRIRNKANGKSYVGITYRPEHERWAEHLSRYRCWQRFSRLYAAMRKYGPENFELTLLAYAFSAEEVRMLETEYIKKFNSCRRGYNCNLGGHGFLELPDHIKRKISAAQIGKVVSAESRRKMSEAKRGDSRCARQLGRHTLKGAENPRSKSYLVQFPDGSIHRIRGMRAFCREHKLTQCKLTGMRKETKGYKLLERFND